MIKSFYRGGNARHYNQEWHTFTNRTLTQVLSSVEMYVRAYTLSEVQKLCTQANLQVISGHAFSIDWLWHGWVITLQKKA